MPATSARPPVLADGPSGTYTRFQGPWHPAIKVDLAPLGAYKLLGPALSEIDGPLVGLEDVVGHTRRLGDQVRSALTWEQRGRLLDDRHHPHRPHLTEHDTTSTR